MNRFTLDTNCIIDLEENRPNAEHVRAIVEAWKSGHIELAVVAVSASENQKCGTANRDFTAFENKLDNAGLSGVQHLLPLAKWDVFYWDHALWSDDGMEKLEEEIRSCLFPGIQVKPPSDIEENSAWRNQFCDVLVAWSNAFHKWGYLVTSDNNFHDHKAELNQLGVGEILYPRDAALRCAP